MRYRTIFSCAGLITLCLLSIGKAGAQPFSFTFVESGLAPLSYGSLTYADYDDDGDFDLIGSGSLDAQPPFRLTAYVARSLGEQLIRTDSSQQWQRQFQETALPMPLWHGGSAWQDYDGDGDLDFIMTGTPSQNTPYDAVTMLYRNDGNGTFERVHAGMRGVYGGDVTWADYDNDGDPDVLLTGVAASGSFETVLYRNENGSFTEVQTGFRKLAYGATAWADYDNDGDLDLVLSGADESNAFGTELYRNQSGAFEQVDANLKGVAFGSVDWGDYDSDGDLDLLLSGGELMLDVFQGLLILYRNDRGQLSEVEVDLPGLVAGEASWGDYDNDGDLDILLVGARRASGGRIGRIYRNDTSGFTLVVNLSGTILGRSTWGDYDGDGDLDILMEGLDSEDRPLTNLYRNDNRLVNTPPESPTGLQATEQGGEVVLRWEAALDELTASAALTYNLRVGTTPGGTDIVPPLSSLTSGRRWIPGPGNAGPGTFWRLADLRSGTYYWSVQAVDASFTASPFAAEGTFDITGGKVDTGTGAEDEIALPTRFALHPNYPNPFMEDTRLGYDLPRPAQVTVTVYNILGAEVARLVEASKPAGRWQVVWDGRDEGGMRVAAGVYFVRMQADRGIWTQKLIVLHP